MRKVLMVVLLIGACAGLMWAQSEQGTTTSGSSSTTTTTTTTSSSNLSGTITAIDTTGNTITVMDPKTNQTTVYHYNQKTTFSRNDQPLKVMELKEGDQITFVSSDGKVINSVVISPSDKANPPKK